MRDGGSGGIGRRTCTSAVALGLVGLLSMAPPALAQAPGPKPTPTCAGLSFTDPAGDARDQQGRSPENLDIVAGFFRFEPDASGKRVVTANIQLKKLDKTVHSGTTGNNWYFLWTVDDVVYYVSAELGTAGTVTYAHGTLATNRFSRAGETTGAFFEGENGIISIVVPAAAKGAEGQTLTSPYATARQAASAPVAGGVVVTVDDGPDNRQGKNYTVAPCEAPQPPPPEQPPPPQQPPVSSTTPPTGTSSPPPSGGGQPPPQRQRLAVRVLTRSVRASSRDLRRRRLPLRLQSSEPVTNVTVQLLSRSRGRSRVVGRARLARLDGRGTLVVRLRGRVRRGQYRLDLAGSGANGGAARVTFRLRIR